MTMQDEVGPVYAKFTQSLFTEKWSAKQIITTASEEFRAAFLLPPDLGANPSDVER
jgi:hypothetical protein